MFSFCIQLCTLGKLIVTDCDTIMVDSSFSTEVSRLTPWEAKCVFKFLKKDEEFGFNLNSVDCVLFDWLYNCYSDLDISFCISFICMGKCVYFLYLLRYDKKF